MVYDAARVGQNCEFCGSPALVAYQAIKSPISPKGVLPFRIDRSRVRDDIRRWWRSKWLAPNRLAKSALVDTVRSLYIPYWTFDAHAHCPWEAEAGHYYYVNVEGRDSKGNRVVRQERRVRWEPAAGVVEHDFDDEPVPGTQGIPIDLLRQVEPFPTGELVPYDTAFLSGHVVEHYQVVLNDVAGEEGGVVRDELARRKRLHLPQQIDRDPLRPRHRLIVEIVFDDSGGRLPANAPLLADDPVPLAVAAFDVDVVIVSRLGLPRAVRVRVERPIRNVQAADGVDEG